MYIQVRTIDCKITGIINISKLNTVEEVKLKIAETLNIDADLQRLFYRGKQLEDGYKMFDYDVRLNDVVQVMIKQDLPPQEEASKPEDNTDTTTSKVEAEPMPEEPTTSSEPAVSKYYKIGDKVDAIDLLYGAWFEATIVGFQHSTSTLTSEDEIMYTIQFDRAEPGETNCIPFQNLRPQAKDTIKYTDLNVKDRVMVNSDIENPEKRGFWYDLEVTSLGREGRASRTKTVVGTLFVGIDRFPIPDRTIIFVDEIMKIEAPKLLELRSDEIDTDAKSDTTRRSSPRKNQVMCESCTDKENVLCKSCGCSVCGGKNDPGKLLLCDECDEGFHLWCLKPPLSKVPEVDDWYCPDCKNDENEIVKAGGKLKESKKKAKMASSTSSSSRDWGKGMACVGRSRVCTIVKPEHFGAIPGIEVGTSWKFRVQVSEDGVHRPHVAGISGRTTPGGGACSLVLSGGYEDDIDNGDSFMYTGSGGRDLSGNKRTNVQSTDQTLTRYNLALAMNCNAPINSKTGATAVDWQGGKPVRVVRNYKLSKHSKYAPEEGNRYDGIYKVVKYYPETGKSGFKVWRYELRRDDKNPAPWTSKGKKRIEELGLTMKYPDGYLEAEAAKEALALKNAKETGISGKRKTDSPTTKKAGKRAPLTNSPRYSPNSKRQKFMVYKPEREILELIAADSINAKLWVSCKEIMDEGKSKFIAKVEEVFLCICCQELVHDPITTQCLHNICKACLKRSFAAEVHTCPLCRFELGEKFKFSVNSNLAETLLKLFPGYEVGR